MASRMPRLVPRSIPPLRMERHILSKAPQRCVRRSLRVLPEATSFWRSWYRIGPAFYPISRSSYPLPSAQPVLVQNGLFSLFPRTALQLLLRIPLYIAASVTAAASYTYYQLTEWWEAYAPVWMLASLQSFYAKSASALASSRTFWAQKILPLFGSTSSLSFGLPASVSKDDDDQEEEEEVSHHVASDAFLSLTKKMHIIKELIASMRELNPEASATLDAMLPSIVVIGSQSSGKSSVLEAIVGQHFLPTGRNMVTRRPLEITMVNDPTAKEMYATFPDLGLERMKDFTKVQKLLRDINGAVPEDMCIDPNPIRLVLHGASLPDLSLVDLPGFIALASAKQPTKLRQKIVQICDKYMQAPNIILAISAADVDLANSEALHASRRADPHGERTVGVLTKMDLVTPEVGALALRNTDYPLPLGYIGVVCAPSSPSILPKPNSNSAHNMFQQARHVERAFFRQFDAQQATSGHGVDVLRSKLVLLLHTHLQKSIKGLKDQVKSNLDETVYHFKVQYNDRRTSAEAYVTELMDVFKQKFKEAAKQYGKPQIRNELRVILEQQAVAILEALYWHDDALEALKKSNTWDDATWKQWNETLEMARARLTKTGIGRISTQMVIDAILTRMEKIISNEPFQCHAALRRDMLLLCNDMLRAKYNVTVDQVENTIKPYKYEVECSEAEWIAGSKRISDLLETHIGKLLSQADAIRQHVGNKQIKAALQHIHDLEQRQRLPLAAMVPIVAQQDPKAPPSESSPFSTRVLEQAQQVHDLEKKAKIIEERLSVLKIGRRSPCHPQYLQSAEQMMAQMSNTIDEAVIKKSCESICPETYLTVVTQKLVNTSVLFIWIELVNEFIHAFPLEVDRRILFASSAKRPSSVSADAKDIMALAKENPKIAKWIQDQDKLERLEALWSTLQTLS